MSFVEWTTFYLKIMVKIGVHFYEALFLQDTNHFAARVAKCLFLCFSAIIYESYLIIH